MPPAAIAGTRGYDRAFDWSYQGAAGGARGALIPVAWDGLALNTGDQPNGLCSVITNVEGWLDSPPLQANNAVRSIADGAAWGPKTLGPRTIVLSGAAAGPRDLLGQLRDQLAVRAAAREPAELAITDSGVGRTLTADVRADSDSYRQAWRSSIALKWRVTLTAADPLLYDGSWQRAVISPLSDDVSTGRKYQRAYHWQYGAPYLANTTILANQGNAAAPVWALYEGELSRSALAAAGGGIIHLAPVDEHMQIKLATATLTAETLTGQSRASYVLPGSRPMLIPRQSAVRWYLASAGRGTVTLAWRSTWV